MIVTHTSEGWSVIFQAAHALLAYKFALELKGFKKQVYWQETLAAIADHDDHKESFGKNVYLTDLGAPKDFTQFKMTARERYLEVKRRIESGSRKHRWIGLLNGRHAKELYGAEKTSQRMKALLLAEEKRTVRVLAELEASVEDFERAYQYLQFCDRISLILCQGEIPAMSRRIEIVSDPNDCRYELWENDDKTVSVDPWPFERSAFEVTNEVRTVKQLQFSNDRELEKRLMAAEVKVRRWQLRRPRTIRRMGMIESRK